MVHYSFVFSNECFIMPISFYHKATFLKSAAKFSQCPPAEACLEVAFVGRSNAGKSSALNTITQQKIAKTSKLPGRTRLINYFSLDDTRYLVDLPGYGFAKVPLGTKEAWGQELNHYLFKRESLCGIILLMDIRHPLKPLDWSIIEWSQSHQKPVHILLTKADKLCRNVANATCLKVKKTLAIYPLITCQLFSSSKKKGVEDVVLVLDKWLNVPNVTVLEVYTKDT